MLKRAAGMFRSGNGPSPGLCPDEDAARIEEEDGLRRLEAELGPGAAAVVAAFAGSSELPDGPAAAGQVRLLLLRYLRAEKGDAAKAAARLEEQAAWRQSSGRVPQDEVAAELARGKVKLQPPTEGSAGRPLLIVKARLHHPGGSPLATQRFIAYCLEATSCYCWNRHSGDGKMVAVFDLAGLKLANLDATALRASFTMLAQHYPERMSAVWMLEVPTIFWGIWKLVEPFIDRTARKAIKFVYGKEGRDALVESLGRDVVPLEYGGDAAEIPVEVAVQQLDAWRQQHHRNAAQEETGGAAATAADPLQLQEQQRRAEQEHADAEPHAATAAGGVDCFVKLELLRADSTSDIMPRCLTGFKIYLDSSCQVSIEPLNSAGNYVNGVWSGFSAKMYEQFVECPTDEGLAIPSAGTPTAIKAAIVKALEGHVYGFDEFGTALNPIPLHATTPLAFAAGRVTVMLPGSVVMVYAVTQITLTASQVDAGLSVMTACSQTPVPTTMCRDSSATDGVGSACPAGRYGSMVGSSIKACAMCPAGSMGNGYGCSACDAGTVSESVGSPACSPCPPGKYAPGGISPCLPCPQHTYTETSGNSACTACPPDAYAWLPGSYSCLRCVKGIPVQCAGADCGPSAGSPGSHIVTTGRLTACALAGEYALLAAGKCTSWLAQTPAVRVQLAFEVAADCSVEILPIADPACADPTSPEWPSYGDIKMSAYYATTDTIRSVLPSTAPPSKGLMVGVDVTAGANAVTVNFWGASNDPADAAADSIKGNIKCTPPNTLVVGGQLVGKPVAPVTQCPPRSYFVANQYCYACPPGYTCPGGATANSGTRVACAAGTYNNLLGGSTCQACSTGFTSNPAAPYCTVGTVQTDCTHATLGLYYDPEQASCVQCPAGTRRDDATQQCVDCLPGELSGAGAKACTPCPAGEFNPSSGLADQSGDTPGVRCLLCPEGSLALKAGAATDVTAVITATGATFCDACPAGTTSVDAKSPCAACADATYRSGDAAPGNNECVRIPAGFKIKPAAPTATPPVLARSELLPCEAGKISFWDEFLTTRTPAASGECVACSSLGAGLAHTYAPRPGMTACIACPAGTVPKNNGQGRTTACQECPDGTYRSSIMKTCAQCGAGREVGPSYKRACTNCDPGFFMSPAMAIDDEDYCSPCPRNTFRANSGATSCIKCPKGTQTQDSGNDECAECPVGFLNNKEGEPCVRAPPGTYVNTIGAVTPTPCPPGTWNNEAGQDSCEPCPPGKYSNNLGSRECKTCAAGAYSGARATRCINCQPGFTSASGSGACAPCKPGSYAPFANADQCSPCPKGYQCPTAGMRKEGPCPKGTFSNREGVKLCSPCPVNTYSNGGGTAAASTPTYSCIKCAQGTNTRGLPGQSKCQEIRPQVTLTPLSAGGSYVEGAWGGAPDALYPWPLECPTVASAAVAPPPGTGKASQLRAAVLAAFEGFAYGFDEESKPRRTLPVARILYAPGRVVVERGSGAGTTLVYAISEASVSSDDLSNDDGSPLRATTACSELNAGPGLDASSQCKGPDEAHLPCDGSYGIVLRPQYDPLKICALCPQTAPSEECRGQDCGPTPSSPGTHILTVGQLTGCALDDSTPWELKAWTKCASWRESVPTLQLSLAVTGDCSIFVSPITDPSCADPADDSGAPYGALQLSAYYANLTAIRTPHSPDAGNRPCWRRYCPRPAVLCRHVRRSSQRDPPGVLTRGVRSSGRGVGMEYDAVSQQCQPCAAGTARNDTLVACVACPPGSYSAEGAAECSLCPAGQYSPTEGLADQSDPTGVPCLHCPVGSLALRSGVAGPEAAVEAGATYCDPCPADTYQDAEDAEAGCVPCDPGYFRSGDAMPANNACQPLPEERR
ncbi:CRAL TRIO domain-containing [Micractinium conductrix]|uniref:CRAL TRIO domain-containing n=1 Tax=Micractinium conductrix TaxID=554055 RepID=A0A2P6VLX2_9CHLO|nr:CRAL TRIO domain-containing [Micractinium conductrix]|eukprot:PSC75080.1 CRAL TRIO domain-containing [Micractinium conductrix]